MDQLLETVAKILGAQWLWNLGTLGLLIWAVRFVDRVRKFPDDPLSKEKFNDWREKYEKAVDSRFDMIERATTSVSQRTRTLWKKLGMSDPTFERISYTEVVHDDPFPTKKRRYVPPLKREEPDTDRPPLLLPEDDDEPKSS